MWTSVLNQFKIEELNKVAQYYLEKDFLVLPDKTIKIDKKDYSIEKGNIENDIIDYKENAYIPNTEVIEKEITKEEILNFYKELAKFANKKYVNE